MSIQVFGACQELTQISLRFIIWNETSTSNFYPKHWSSLLEFNLWTRQLMENIFDLRVRQIRTGGCDCTSKWIEAIP